MCFFFFLVQAFSLFQKDIKRKAMARSRSVRKAPSHQQRERPIPQSTRPSGLAKTIRASLENPKFSDVEKERFIDRLLFSYLMPVELMLSPELTQREQDCFRLTELNLNAAEIGKRLSIS